MAASAVAEIAMLPRHEDRWRNEQPCTDHRPFRSPEAALAHYIEQLRANTTDVGQVVYWCRGHWHHGGGIRSLERLIREAGGDDADD